MAVSRNVNGNTAGQSDGYGLDIRNKGQDR